MNTAVCRVLGPSKASDSDTCVSLVGDLNVKVCACVIFVAFHGARTLQTAVVRDESIRDYQKWLNVHVIPPPLSPINCFTEVGLQ